MSVADAETQVEYKYGGLVRLTFVVNPYHRYTVAVREDAESDDWSPDILIPSVTKVAGAYDDGKTEGLMRWATNLTCDYFAQQFGDLRATAQMEEVLFNRLMENAKTQREIVRDDSAKFGSLVHEWCEAHILAVLAGTGRLGKVGDQELPINESAVNCITGFLKWEAKHRPQYLWSERKVYSLEHHVAGTVDIGAVLRGKYYVIDLKTSNSIGFGYKVQLAAYLGILNEEAGQELFTHRGIIKLHKGTDRISTWYDFNERAKNKQRGWGTQEQDWQAFLDLRSLYRRATLGTPERSY